jgi:hypothetical protein
MLVLFICFNITNAGERSFVGEETLYDLLSSEHDQLLYNPCDATTMTSKGACDGIVPHMINSFEPSYAESFYFNVFESTDTLQNNFVDFENAQSPAVEKRESTTNDCITDILVNMDTNEPFPTVNTSELEELKPVDLKNILDSQQRIIDLPTQPNAPIFEIDHFVYNVDENPKVMLSNDNISQFNLKDRRDFINKKYMLTFKIDIIDFIRQNFPDDHAEFYIKRLECIECAYNFIKHDDSIFSESHKQLSSTGSKILEVLYLLSPNYLKKDSFDSKTSQDFLSKFDTERRKSLNGISYCKITKSSKDYRTYFLYTEILKLYKYTDKIPELLFLSGLFFDRSYCDISFFLNLMNSFIENVDNLEDHKVFILCMLSKAILSSNKKNLDLFLFPEYHFVCHKEHLNLHFLLWEIYPGKRADMKKRLKTKSVLISNDVDKRHLKSILLIYLYQHFDFLIYYNFNDEKIGYFYDYVIMVLNSKNCVACDLEEYLEILKTHLSSLK